VLLGLILLTYVVRGGGPIGWIFGWSFDLARLLSGV
jgi:hypothetical protein